MFSILLTSHLSIFLASFNTIIIYRDGTRLNMPPSEVTNSNDDLTSGKSTSRPMTTIITSHTLDHHIGGEGLGPSRLFKGIAGVFGSGISGVSDWVSGSDKANTLEGSDRLADKTMPNVPGSAAKPNIMPSLPNKTHQTTSDLARQSSIDQNNVTKPSPSLSSLTKHMSRPKLSDHYMTCEFEDLKISDLNNLLREYRELVKWSNTIS